MYCPECGSQVGDNAKFCENCGTALANSRPSEGRPVPPPASNATAQQPTPPSQDAPQASQQHAAPATASAKNGKATAALVCGILAIVFAESIVVGLVLGIVAIVLAVQATKQGPDGRAKAGKICGIIGLILSVIALVFSIVTGVAAVSYIMDGNDNVIGISIDPSGDKADSNNSSKADNADKPSKDHFNQDGKSGSAATPQDTVYENERYGFSFKVPQGFDMTTQSANGDGATFYNKALHMTVYVSGYNNINGLTPERIVETTWAGDDDAVSKNDDTTAYLSQEESDDQVIHYWYVGAGSINELTIKYPEKDNDTQEAAMAEQLIKGFEVGSIASTH